MWGSVEVIKPFIYRSINRARLENKLSVEGMTVKQEEENIRSRCRRCCCKEKYKWRQTKLVESKNEAPLFDNHGNVQQNSKAEAERRCEDLRNFYVRLSIRLGGLWHCTEYSSKLLCMYSPSKLVKWRKACCALPGPPRPGSGALQG